MKTDNAKGAHAAKVAMRQRVLDELNQSYVFDAFSGLGSMWRDAWQNADGYLGCDERDWSPSEPHKRMVCDNRLALRVLDLSRFNVFDLDAYGSPWEQMLILAARRQWLSGERGAVVLTDGTSMKTRFGGFPAAMAQLVGSGMSKAPTDSDSDAIQRIALKRWLELSKVAPLRQWMAQGRGSGKGGQRMTYTAVVFEGQTAKAS